ncbi:MAG: glycosyltransferase family 4 protein [Dongiaceae bacterium]
MRVLVLSTMVPFVHGGAEIQRDALLVRLRRRGIAAEAMSLPFLWEPYERVVEEMVLARSLRIARADRVIALKFPAYLVPCESKVVWLIHQYRQAYDMFEAGHSNIPQTARGAALRAMVAAADTSALTEARSVFTSSPVTRDRLLRFNGLEAAVLPVPLDDPERFGGGPSDGYIVATGRVGALKRQWLLLRALRHAPGVRAVIAGPPDRPQDAEELRRLLEAEGLSDRVRLVLRFLPRDDLAELVNRSLGVACLPFEEDTASFVAMEAFQAGKPVLTLTDSGGVLDLVRDGETGWVAAPTPESLGAALRAMAAAPAEAAARGEAGRRAFLARGVAWPQTLDRLLA